MGSHSADLEFLVNAAGHYVGSKLLWFKDPNQPEESQAKISVSENEITYSWAYGDQPQTGQMIFENQGDQVSVEWVDTWHATDGFRCLGTQTSAKIVFLCQYGPEDQPQWGWRTELSCSGPGKLLIEMFNISPEGKEDIAVRLNGRRL